MVLVVRAAVPASFTHVGPGTSAQTWRRHREWGSGTPVALDGVSRLFVVAAHPDDESLGGGGLVATAVHAGVAVEIVCATDGEGSHPDSPTHPPPALAAVRAAEGLAAAAALGVGSVHRLSFPDGDVAAHQEALTTFLVSLVGDGRGAVIVAPWREDGHPDHEAAGRAASAAARRTGADLWEYPVWFWHWATPDDAPWELLRPLALSEDAVRAKQRAIGAHQSQVSPLSPQAGDETLLSPALLEHFGTGPEHYLVTPSHEADDGSLERLHQESEDPWGVGSRWYEQRKRELVLAMLPAARFGRTLEVGCSTGALAEALATRSDSVLGVDSSVAALDVARRRFEGEDRVTVSRLEVPHDWPEQTFDLVVVSEVGYFMSPAELEQLVSRTADSLGPHGVLVLCHWWHPTEGWVLDGPDVHAGFLDDRLPPVAATYRDRDIEIRVHARGEDWPDPLT